MNINDTYIDDSFIEEDALEDASIENDSNEESTDNAVGSSEKEIVESLSKENVEKEASIDKNDMIASQNSDSEEDNNSSDEKKSMDEIGSVKLEDNSKDEVVEDSKSAKDFNFPNLIGKKIGMTQLFSTDGIVFPATVVEAGPCTVTQIKDTNNDGYNSVQIGYLGKKESKTTKPLLGHFSKAKTDPKKILKEFRVNSTVENLLLGSTISVNQFEAGDFIKVTGFSKGRGFAGHMKRHGFSGGRASHGKNSVMRKAGSVGAGTSPGRIFPGMKMAGRMGNSRVSIKNLQILNIDEKNNLIFVKGSIPGPNNRIVFLTKS